MLPKGSLRMPTVTKRENIINRKILIMKSGRTQRRVYEMVGVTRMGFYKALCGITQNPVLHEKIAKAVNVPKEIFWPEFYGNGKGRRQQNVRVKTIIN